jgi:hypothetical protein
VDDRIVVENLTRARGLIGGIGFIQTFEPGLTDFLYQRDREIIASARPDPEVVGTG